MTTLLEAAKKALEALDLRCGTNADERKPSGAITTLRTAIEAAEKVEPVAWQVKYVTPAGIPQIDWFPHPVHPDSPLAKHGYTEEPLYTHPTPAIEAIEPFDASDNRFREAFEESIRSGNYPVTRKGYGYRSPMTHMAFDIAFATVNRLKLYLHPPSTEIEATEIGNEIN